MFIEEKLEKTRREIIEEIRNIADIPLDLKKALIRAMRKANLSRMYMKLISSDYYDMIQDQIIDYLVKNTVKTYKSIESDTLDDIVRPVVYEVMPSMS